MKSTLYRNGVVYAPRHPAAEALIVQDGVIEWVGTDEDAEGLTAAVDEVVDVDGALIAPGFVDAHVHLLETGLALEGVDLSPGAGVRSLADALGRIARAADRTDRNGQVVHAFGWDETGWPEGRAPTRAELDAAGGGVPVYASRVDLHSAVVSTALADRAGLLRPGAPPGWDDTGRVEREAQAAARAVVREVDPARRTALYRAALSAAAARGIVSVHEHSTPQLDTRTGLGELLETTRDPASALPLVVGYRAELLPDHDAARELLAAVPGLTGLGGDLTADGSLGSRTAALRDPYCDLPAGADGARGELYLSAEDLCAHIVAATRAGVHAAVHVIGDRAMDEVVLALRAAGNVLGAEVVRAAGHRLEHAEMVDARTLAELVVLGVSVSVQPAFDATWGGTGGMYQARLGAARMAGLNPLADLVGAGLPLAFGSDTPVTPLDPWGGVRAAVHHHQEHQRLTTQAAFHAHTRGGWEVAGLGGRGHGEITVGAPASIVVWQVEELVGQAGNQHRHGRVAAWQDAPVGAALPNLEPGSPEPVCLRTLRDGVVLHDALS